MAIHQFPENSFQSYISPPQGSFSKQWTAIMTCVQISVMIWNGFIINSDYFVMYIIHIAVNNLWVYLPPKKNWKCNRKTLSRQPEETANHSPTCSLSLNYILNSTLYALGMNEGSDVTQQVSCVHICVTQNAREKNLLELQRINWSCLTLIGDALPIRGHSSNQQKGRLNSHNITPRHSFLTIFLSLYSKRVQKLLQKWFNLLYLYKTLLKSLR